MLTQPFHGSNRLGSRPAGGWRGRLLRRAPDAGGMSGAVALLRAGAPEELVAAILAGSDEYLAGA